MEVFLYLHVEHQKGIRHGLTTDWISEVMADDRELFLFLYIEHPKAMICL
jgi:hypothetical protein